MDAIPTENHLYPDVRVEGCGQRNKTIKTRRRRVDSYCAACSSVFIDNRFEQHHTIASRSRACEYQALLRTSIPA